MSRSFAFFYEIILKLYVHCLIFLNHKKHDAQQIYKRCANSIELKQRKFFLGKLEYHFFCFVNKKITNYNYIKCTANDS